MVTYIRRRPRLKRTLIVVGVLLLIYGGLGVWSIYGDEPQWVDTLTDPAAHVVAFIRRLLGIGE